MGRKRHIDIADSEFSLNNFVEETKEEAVPLRECDKTPLPEDPEWTDYVLSYLTDEEVDAKGNPTVAGLGRILLKLIGPYTFFKPDLTPADENNGKRASVVFGISIQDIYYPNETGAERHVYGTADACPDNVFGDNIFKGFSAAIAETRAEGRAYKRALYLRKVVTAEELASPDSQTPEEQLITSTQINVLDVNCSKLDVDVMAYANLGKEKYANIKDVPRTKAARMNKLLNDFDRGEAKENVKKVIESVKGYKKGWRNV